MKPLVYLGGKIGKTDWRHELIPNLRSHEWSDRVIPTNDFNYIGPFFVSCDHGCRHTLGQHGATGYCGSPDLFRQQVYERNNQCLDDSDLLFVYIDAPDCFGTIFEVGRASAAKKRIVLCFSPEMEPQEFWYLCEAADKAYVCVRPNDLNEIFADEVRNTVTWLKSKVRR